MGADLSDEEMVRIMAGIDLNCDGVARFPELENALVCHFTQARAYSSSFFSFKSMRSWMVFMLKVECVYAVF
jgi:hypothetical protein